MGKVHPDFNSKNLLQNPVNECNFLIIYMGINQKTIASCEPQIVCVFFSVSCSTNLPRLLNKKKLPDSAADLEYKHPLV